MILPRGKGSRREDSQLALTVSFPGIRNWQVRDPFLCDFCPWGLRLIRESKIHWLICLTSFRGDSAPRATELVTHQLIVTKALMHQTPDTHAFSRRNQPGSIPHAWISVSALLGDRPSFFITHPPWKNKIHESWPRGGPTLPSLQIPVSVVGNKEKRLLSEEGIDYC